MEAWMVQAIMFGVMVGLLLASGVILMLAIARAVLDIC